MWNGGVVVVVLPGPIGFREVNGTLVTRVLPKVVLVGGLAVVVAGAVPAPEGTIVAPQNGATITFPLP